jgi:hypothetical protein
LVTGETINPTTQTAMSKVATMGPAQGSRESCELSRIQLDMISRKRAISRSTAPPIIKNARNIKVSVASAERHVSYKNASRRNKTGNQVTGVESWTQRKPLTSFFHSGK